MKLVKELDFTYSNTHYTFSTFTHRILPNKTVHYYMNDDRGISIYDDDWNFIRRIDLHSVNPYISLRGNIYIYDEFIYIGNVYYSMIYNEFMFLKVDFNLHIFNYIHLLQDIPSTFDYCNKKIFLIRKGGLSKINIDVYDLNLRKISEINAIDLDTTMFISGGLGLFNNQLYIYYEDMNLTQIILVTDLNGQYITKYVLIQTPFYFYLNPFTFDYFGNILFTTGGKLCLINTFLNKMRKCTQVIIDDSPYLAMSYYDYSSSLDYWSTVNYPLYAQVDQSGRLVVIDSFEKKVKFYGPFET
jgi:hypothetical protein